MSSPASHTLPVNLPALTYRRILNTWWPLAASWLLMGVEGPAVNAIMARLADPEIHLAAWGGVVYPLALIVEAPIIMLLAASTALCRDWASYQKLNRFMWVSGAGLTALHALTAFTPVFDVVARQWLNAPTVILEPARLGLMLMLPWTWSIAYRRFHQGVLIRLEHSRSVGMGTVIRLSANGLVLLLGYFISTLYGSLPGIAVGSAAIAAGVLSEATYVGIIVQPVLRHELRPLPNVSPALTLKSFLAFYIPLALTSLIGLVANPIGSAAIGRMPQALESLAVWSVVIGLIFIFRSAGFAFNEVVVALLELPEAAVRLWRFTLVMSLVTSTGFLVLTATPLADVWMVQLSALAPPLAHLARQSLWLALPLPALSVLQSWYQGKILHHRRTQGITESVVVYLLVDAGLLGLGVLAGSLAGMYVGLGALTLGTLAQTAWLWWRSRQI